MEVSADFRGKISQNFVETVQTPGSEAESEKKKKKKKRKKVTWQLLISIFQSKRRRSDTWLLAVDT